MQAFNAKIVEAASKGGAYIEIPFNVEEVYGAKRVKVKATFDGIEYRGSLVRMGTECHILGITKAIRKQLGKSIGDTVLVTLKEDTDPRFVEVPLEFKKTLEQNPELLEFWNTLSYSAQKKYGDWMLSAKKEETRIKRIALSIEKLKNKEKL